MQLRHLRELEAAVEEWVFTVGVVRDHTAGKAFIPRVTAPTETPLAEIAHWKHMTRVVSDLAAKVQSRVARPLPQCGCTLHSADAVRIS